MVTPATDPSARARLTWPKLVLLILGFVLIPQLVSLFIFHFDALEEGMNTVRGTVSTEWVPDAGGALIALWVVRRMNWWRPVFREELRTRRWVWVAPIVIVAGALTAADWTHLGTIGAGLVVAVTLAAVTTGISEELMFRGVTLQAMRESHGEFVAAMSTSLLFGLMHLINALIVGSAAIGEVVIAFAMGYVLYVCRRVSGGLVVPMIVHAAHDFSSFSYEAGSGAPDTAGQAESLLLMGEFLIFIVLLVGYRRLSGPKPDPAAEPA